MASFSEIMKMISYGQAKNLEWRTKERTLLDTVRQRQFSININNIARGTIPPPRPLNYTYPGDSVTIVSKSVRKKNKKNIHTKMLN